ncbi:MAG: asparagine synthase (glutamine-hydrolyzing) [Desulfomonilaceae bacterium]|jgi:asparagine synthase (glutamine-hydrolysing)
MCGIAGIVDFNNQPSETTLNRMTEALRHRGPDAEGTCRFEKCALGHRRLSIIDLTEAANQPMFSDDGLQAIVFNGEIYNFRELREFLESKGHRFRTQSDTEVLLRLYIEKKDELLPYLNGMFSFAIWDDKEQRLFLARDRMGKKPLYYSIHGKRLSFSSELRSLVQDSTIPKSIYHQALSEYFLYDFIPAPHTIFSGVNKLEAGRMAIFDETGMRISKYWVPPIPESGLDYNSCRNSLLNVLLDSTNKRMVADVPLGAFLSGGIDSTLIASLMTKTGASEVRTFSISFPGTTHDEAKWSRIAAGYIGSQHTEHRVDFDIENVFTKLVTHFGEPFGDSSAIPTWRLCQETRKDVTVALSGDGGDELFGGYERYIARRLQNIYDCLPRTLREKFIEPLVMRTKASTDYYGFSATKKIKLFIDASNRIRRNPSALTPQTFSIDDVRALTGLTYDPGLDPAIANADQWPALDPVSRMMFTDIQTYLADDILTKVDRMSMAHALEVRSPLLDHRIVEFACRLPLRFKIRGTTTKRILRDVAQGVVPDEIIGRSKQGFQTPIGEWFKTSLKKWCEHRLFDYDHGFMEKRLVEKIWKDHQEARSDNASRIWLILFFNEWVEQFG